MRVSGLGFDEWPFAVTPGVARMNRDEVRARLAHLGQDGQQEVLALFEAAIARDPEERRDFVDAAAAGDRRVAAEVDALLERWNDEADAFVEADDASAERPTTGGGHGRPAGDTLKAGACIGPYVIQQEIGRGGMGVVYLAEDTRLSRRVALKAIRPEFAAGAEQRERLRREARAAAALAHAGIATVYALEEIEGALYIASEFVPGRTLRAMLQDGPLPSAMFIDAATQVARVLAAAHAQGIVHRDLKPENVMRAPSGAIKVLDFGVAHWESVPNTRLTQTGTVVGTPGYMAPEQLLDEPVDFRADVFAFGVLLYEMASGSNPFEASTLTATIGNVLQAQPARLSETSNASAALDRIVETCLAKRPAGRYQSTAALVADLESVRTGIASPRMIGAAPRDSNEAPPVRRTVTSRWWWEFHQLMVSAIYVLTLYPAWRARVWMPEDCGMPFFLLVLACASAATTLRLNLRFTARMYPSELPAQRARAGPWIRGSDIGFAATLLLGTVAIASKHPEIGTLFLTIAVVSLAASFIIEPTTTKAAFRRRSGALRAAKRDI